MGSEWAQVFQTLLDFLTLKDTGVGPACVAFILMLLVCMLILYRAHLYVMGRLLEEMKRTTDEKNDWKNMVFEGKLLSSQSERYTAPTPQSEETPTSGARDELVNEDE